MYSLEIVAFPWNHCEKLAAFDIHILYFRNSNSCEYLHSFYSFHYAVLWIFFFMNSSFCSLLEIQFLHKTTTTKSSTVTHWSGERNTQLIEANSKCLRNFTEQLPNATIVRTFRTKTKRRIESKKYVELWNEIKSLPAGTLVITVW